MAFATDAALTLSLYQRLKRRRLFFAFCFHLDSPNKALVQFVKHETGAIGSVGGTVGLAH